MANPPQLLIPSPKKILESIPWIDGNQLLVEFILGLAEKRVYQYGDAIMKIGDVPDGIHFIVSGLVKVKYISGYRHYWHYRSIDLIWFVAFTEFEIFQYKVVIEC